MNPHALSRRARGGALALAASLLLFPLASPAQTQVTLYGLADGYVARVSNSLPSKTHDVEIGSGGMSTSFIGISASEELGGGYRGYATLESFLRLDTGQYASYDGEPFWAREAVVGLAAPWGKLAIGRNTSALFLATVDHNPFGDSFVVSPMVTHVFRGTVQGETAMVNSVRYQSPTLGGFKLDALYSAGSETTDPADRDSGQAVDVGLTWAGGPLSAVLAMRRIDLNTARDGHDQRVWLAGASYDLSFMKVSAQYMGTKDSWSGLPDAERKTWQLGASVPVGDGALLASFARTSLDDSDAATPDRRRTWALGYLHTLSTRTDVYLSWYDDRLDEPTDNRQKVLVLGMRHQF